MRAVLRGGDDVWKFGIIVEFLLHCPRALRDAVGDDITRIINSPTEGERAEEVDLAARDVLFMRCYVDDVDE